MKYVGIAQYMTLTILLFSSGIISNRHEDGEGCSFQGAAYTFVRGIKNQCYAVYTHPYSIELARSTCNVKGHLLDYTNSQNKVAILQILRDLPEHLSDIWTETGHAARLNGRRLLFIFGPAECNILKLPSGSGESINCNSFHQFVCEYDREIMETTDFQTTTIQSATTISKHLFGRSSVSSSTQLLSEHLKSSTKNSQHVLSSAEYVASSFTADSASMLNTTPLYNTSKTSSAFFLTSSHSEHKQTQVESTKISTKLFNDTDLSTLTLLSSLLSTPSPIASSSLSLSSSFPSSSSSSAGFVSSPWSQLPLEATHAEIVMPSNTAKVMPSHQHTLATSSKSTEPPRLLPSAKTHTMSKNPSSPMNTIIKTTRGFTVSGQLEQRNITNTTSNKPRVSSTHHNVALSSLPDQKLLSTLTPTALFSSITQKTATDLTSTKSSSVRTHKTIADLAPTILSSVRTHKTTADLAPTILSSVRTHKTTADLAPTILSSVRTHKTIADLAPTILSSVRTHKTTADLAPTILSSVRTHKTIADLAPTILSSVRTHKTTADLAPTILSSLMKLTTTTDLKLTALFKSMTKKTTADVDFVSSADNVSLTIAGLTVTKTNTNNTRFTTARESTFVNTRGEYTTKNKFEHAHFTDKRNASRPQSTSHYSATQKTSVQEDYTVKSQEKFKTSAENIHFTSTKNELTTEQITNPMFEYTEQQQMDKLTTVQAHADGWTTNSYVKPSTGALKSDEKGKFSSKKDMLLILLASIGGGAAGAVIVIVVIYIIYSRRKERHVKDIQNTRINPTYSSSSYANDFQTEDRNSLRLNDRPTTYSCI